MAELLYHHDRLSVPGLGTFEMSHAPALVDQVQGQVNAPTKNIRFNTNLVLDDGVLVDTIHQRKGWSLSESNRWLAEQVGQINAALDRKEIVELPGVGRFFRNFEHKLQFVAENVNFSLESYGLQAVKGQLVPRSVSEKIPAIQNKMATAVPTPATTKAATGTANDWTWLRASFVWIIAGFIVLAFVVGYLFYPWSSDDPQEQEAIANVPQERLNASPSKIPDDETTTVDSSENSIEAPATSGGESTSDNPSESGIDTEAPTLSPEEHSAVIAVGLFGNADNVQRLLQQLSEAGYSPIQRPEGKNTRVGVSIRYRSERELEATLQEIRSEFTSSAFIMTRDGQDVD